MTATGASPWSGTPAQLLHHPVTSDARHVLHQFLPSCPSNNTSQFSFILSLQKSSPCLVCQITLNIPYLKYHLNSVGPGSPSPGQRVPDSGYLTLFLTNSLKIMFIKHQLCVLCSTAFGHSAVLLPDGFWFTHDPKATAKISFPLQDPANHSHSLILCDNLPLKKLNYPPFLGCQSSHLICLMSWL